mmetsp:Transcript_4084/g.7537  ORF Transcript_4084/g.7537 Transcript_4084/m.7537 type:complete len:125 (-) Transcript_4084:55-429(-)
MHWFKLILLLFMFWATVVNGLSSPQYRGLRAPSKIKVQDAGQAGQVTIETFGVRWLLLVLCRPYAVVWLLRPRRGKEEATLPRKCLVLCDWRGSDCGDCLFNVGRSGNRLRISLERHYYFCPGM